MRASISNHASIVVDAFVFRKTEWRQTGEGEQRGVEGIPGTWSESPMPGKVPAMVSCPNCGTISLLHFQVHHVDRLGKVEPDFRCTNRHSCSFHRKIYLDQWNNKPLYACAIEHFQNGQWTPEIHYMHAKDEKEARLHLGPGNYKIVAIGRAIGHFVHDSHGEKLSADGKFINDEKDRER